MKPQTRNPLLPLLVGGLAFEALLLGLVALGDLRTHLSGFLALWTALFAVLLVAHRYTRGMHHRRALLIALGFTALFRVTLLPAAPSLSEDVYRYAWDGRVTASGVNPYDHPPNAPELAALRTDDLFDQLNSPQHPSIYPPLSQALFAGASLISSALFGGSVAATVVLLKLLMASLDFGAVLLLVPIMRAWQIDLRHLLLYAWNPLPIVEFAGNAHSDAAMVFCLVLMLGCVVRHRPTGASLALVGAALTKLFPVVLVPFVLRRIGWRYAAVIIAAGLIGAAPMLIGDAPRHIAEAVQLYYRYFEFNAGPYYALKHAGGWLLGEDVSKTLGPAMGAAYLVFAVITFALWRPTDPKALARVAMVLFGGYLLCATTVHPWYVTWVLCLVPLLPGKAWVFLSFAVGWTYLSYLSDPPREWFALIAAEYAVFAGLLAHDLRGWRAGVTGISGVAAVSGIAQTDIPDTAAIPDIPDIPATPAPPASPRTWLLDRLMRARARWKVWHLRRHLVGESLLDVGAGEGWVGLRLAQTTQMAVQLLDVVDFNRTPLPMTVYDGRTMPFEDDAFDTVIVLTALHHAEDAERVIDECVRVCRQRLIVTESVYRTSAGLRVLTALDRFFNRLRSGGAMDEQVHFRRSEQWLTLFRARGLKPMQTRWLSRGIHKHVMFVLDQPRQRTQKVTQPASAGRSKS